MPSNTRSSGSPGSKWEKHGEGYRLDFVDSKMSHESMSDLREAIL